MVRERILHLTRDDFDWETFRSGGPGGQNQNKRDTGVRVRHRPSGAAAESRAHRTQVQNKRAAFGKLARSPEFQGWLRVEHARRAGALDIAVEEAMHPSNLVIEYGPFD